MKSEYYIHKAKDGSGCFYVRKLDNGMIELSISEGWAGHSMTVSAREWKEIAFLVQKAIKHHEIL